MTRAEVLASLEAERYMPSPTRYPTTQEVRERHAVGLDEHGDRRPVAAMVLVWDGAA